MDDEVEALVEGGMTEEVARATVKKLHPKVIPKQELYTRARQHSDGTYTSTRAKEIADNVVSVSITDFLHINLSTYIYLRVVTFFYLIS